MADALCGPSNALQNFQKHTAVDRTLQQDRIVNRHSPTQQNFRSQNPNAAVLDPEFEAFENNFQNAVPRLGVGSPAFGHPVHPQSVPGVANGGDWASDFQKLHVSSPSQNIIQSHGVMQNQALHPSPLNGWQNEFMQQQQPHQPQQIHQPQFQQQNPMANFQSPFMHNHPGMNGMTAPVDQGSAQSTSTLGKTPVAFDESAFEAAFSQAQADMHEQEMTISEQNQTLEEEVVSKELDGTSEVELNEQIRIGSDLIGDNKTETSTERPKDDPDELARTAGHLLDSLSHDTSQKFKESSFLALMRRIRDREVRIEGDEFRETQQPLHPGGKDYPEKHKAVDVEELHNRSTVDFIPPE